MKIHVLGSCAGSMPAPGRHHTSVAVETETGLDWFDAGENCAFTAWHMGLDFTRIHRVFISHTHMDHIGGLANLLWDLRKLRTNGIDLIVPRMYLPEPEAFEGILQLLRHTEGGFSGMDPVCFRVKDGVYEERGVSVQAMHNLHLPLAEDGEGRSFSYCVEAEGKRVVISGDIRTLPELEPLVSQGCDLLLLENGHHRVAEQAAFLAEQGWPIGKLVFYHNGEPVRNDPAGQLAAVREVYSGECEVAYDGETLEL